MPKNMEETGEIMTDKTEQPTIDIDKITAEVFQNVLIENKQWKQEVAKLRAEVERLTKYIEGNNELVLKLLAEIKRLRKDE